MGLVQGVKIAGGGHECNHNLIAPCGVLAQLVSAPAWVFCCRALKTQHWHGFVGHKEKAPVQVWSGGEISEAKRGVLWRRVAKEKAEVGAPAFRL